MSALRRFVLVWLVSLCGLVGALGFALSPAVAFQTHLFEGGFGPDGTAATQFVNPSWVAVDQSTGNIYVDDVFAQTVQKFDGTHEPEPFTGISPGIVEGKLAGLPPYTTVQLAVDSTSHGFYVEDGSVKAYQADGEPAEFTAGPGAGTNEITGSEVCGVAVDASGDIYVSEFSTGVRVFASSGAPLAAIAASGLCSLAVDSHGTVYAKAPGSSEAGSLGPIHKFTPTPLELPVVSSTSYSAAGTLDANPAVAVAVDPGTDRVYVDEGSQIVEYDEGGAPLGSFGAGVLPNPEGWGSAIAVNGATGRIYVAQGNAEGQVEVFGPDLLLPDVTTGAASEVRPQGTATLNGTVDPDGVEVTDCHFDYGTSAAYGQTAACEQAVGSGSGEVAVTAKLTALKSGTTYHFRLEASNHSATNPGGINFGKEVTFTTPPPPSIDATSTANLTGSSVDLNAQVNPGGSTTACRFEYGASVAYGTSTACEPASLQGSMDIAVKQHIPGLSPNVTYHWRVVATSEAGTTTGVDHTFVYDTSGGGLPDNRAYEMVTPLQKNGAAISDVIFGISHDISEDGSRLISPTTQCFADAVACDASRGPVGSLFLFSRTSTGWTSTALAPPATRFEASASWMTSANSGTGLFSMPTLPSLEDDFYVRRTDGSFVDIGPGTPPADGAAGALWSGTNSRTTSDFSRVVYQEPHAWPFDKSTGYSVYEFSGAGNTAPVLVGVSGGPGSTDLISRCNTTLGANGANYENPGEMSADGETVYFTVAACSEGTGANVGTPVPAAELYARIGGARTVRISERSRAACTTLACRTSPDEEAAFAGASNDGSKAFFTSSQQLTDGGTSQQNNLYEYDFDNPVGENPIDVSAGDLSSHGPRVQGVVAISADGSHVYFVAEGVLAAGANGQGETARDGANNLYVFEHDQAHPRGRVVFVAQLPESDSNQWVNSDNYGKANVTPDGRFLVFESHGDLTSDDTRTDGAVQIFRYDAQTGALVRISIGEHGWSDNGNGGIGNGVIVPAWLGFEHAGASRSDPTMSHDGSFVFFESPVGLTSRALNGVKIGTYGTEAIYAENVYEWHEGQVYLISDGRDTAVFGNASAVSLLGSDATGSNVFFSTADSPVPQDTDIERDIYDARICTATDPCVAAPPAALACSDETCRGVLAGSPLAPGTTTTTFSGPGNVSVLPTERVTPRKAKKRAVRCPRSRRRVRGRCVKAKAKGRNARAMSRKGDQ